MTDLWALPFTRAEFPAAAENRLTWVRPKHSDSGVQEWGYDLGAVRWVGNSWRENPSSGPTNNDWILYGTKVHAMQDGVIVAGWRNAPENEPGKLNPNLPQKAGDPTRIYGGGNGLWILHADGTLAEYAHFQPGSIPVGLVPHEDELLPQPSPSTNVGDCWKQIVVPAAERKSVKKGDVIGVVGNSGTSSNPHLHIHREQGTQFDENQKSGGQAAKISFEQGWYSPRVAPATITWTSFAGQPIPPGADRAHPRSQPHGAPPGHEHAQQAARGRRPPEAEVARKHARAGHTNGGPGVPDPPPCPSHPTRTNLQA